MRQAMECLSFETPGRGLSDITAAINEWIGREHIGDGLLTVFIRHTSASLVVQENADPDVLLDLDSFFARIAPEESRLYRHRSEGPDDMPAHIKSALTQTHLAIPVRDGRLALGTWQGIYLFEHRARPHRRTIELHLLGE